MGNYRLEINHPWPDNTLLGAFFLSVTNFILLGGIFVAVRIQQWSTAGVLIYLMLTSTAYHACRGGLFCMMRFRDAQDSDHLAVFAALLWIAARCAAKHEWFPAEVLQRRPEMVLELAGLLFFVMYMPVAGFVLNNPESAWCNVFGFGVAAATVGASSLVTGAPIFYQPRYGWTGLFIFAFAIIFYAVCPKSWYDAAHSIWHVLSMIAIPFLIMGCHRPLPQQR